MLMQRSDYVDITQLYYFKVTAETGSLTKAAKLLNISQPAMSLMIKKLEDELGVELFDRTPNRIVLNKTGKAALCYVNDILQSTEKMKSDLADIAGKNLSVSIGFCDQDVRWYSVPRFLTECPDVKIKDELCLSSDAEKMLSEHKYNIVVTPKKIDKSNVYSKPFLRDRLFLSVAKDNNLADKISVYFKDIPKQALLFPEIGGYYLDWVEEHIKSENPELMPIKNDMGTTSYLVRSTNFLAMVSSLSIELRNDGTHRTLVPLADDGLDFVWYISCLKSNKNRLNPIFEAAENMRKEQNENNH